MIIPITALYAALLVAVLCWLTVRVGLIRGKTGVSLLDGGNEEVLVEMRRHGNFVEHVPLLLILMGIIEANAGSPILLHVAGALLLVFRVVHPLGLRHDRAATPMRAIGAGGTFLLMIALGLVALWQGIGAL